MWRVDVFCKTGKFHLVPIYQSDRNSKAALPNRAVVAYADRNEWTAMDADFEFCFSLSFNDLIRLKTKKSEFFGYFSGLNVATGAINITVHDRNIEIGKKGVWESLGVKVGVEAFEKFHADVLGNHYPAKPEARRGLA